MLFSCLWLNFCNHIILWQTTEQREEEVWHLLTIPAHIGSCLHVKHLLHHFPTHDYKPRQVQSAASHLWWRLHIPFSFRLAASILVSAMAGVTACRIQHWAICIWLSGISRTLLVSHRYFSQFQVVTKMDDPFPLTREMELKGFWEAEATGGWHRCWQHAVCCPEHSCVFSTIIFYIPSFAQSRMCMVCDDTFQ